MQTSLQGIAKKAKLNKKYRFRDLYRLLNEENLQDSWKYLNNKAASGVDRISMKEFEANLLTNIQELVTSLKEKRYRAKLVRRVNIPKSNGKHRSLGIPTIGDKLIQKAVARILEAIYEQDFLSCSYGYRPTIGAKDAVREITTTLTRGRYGYILDADLQGFFDHINHQWLLKMLEERIDDKPFIHLITKWLKAGILSTDGKILHPVTGTPQGGIVSPLLANIYLHYVLDLWFEKKVKPNCKGEAYLCRYADDFTCAFRFKDDAEEFYKALIKRLGKFGFSLSPDKTIIIKFSRFEKDYNNYFEFLGFEFRWGTSRKGKDIIKRRTSRKKLLASLERFTLWCRKCRNLRLRVIFKLLNAKLRGYYNYYGIIGNFASLQKFFFRAMRILYKWLNRRSQKRSFCYNIFNQITKFYNTKKPRITEFSQPV
ncbi:MAG: group II intron reverse transcriptase/maturase [Firmicutes bacterium]|nr:group II intron reverse transcriptase/maturase [Bacillota bacterium]